MDRAEAVALTQAALIEAGKVSFRVTIETPDKEWASNLNSEVTVLLGEPGRDINIISSRESAKALVLDLEPKKAMTLDEVDSLVTEILDEFTIEDTWEQYVDYDDDDLIKNSFDRKTLHWINNISSYLEVEQRGSLLDPAPADKAKFFGPLHSRNKGLFYRGVGKGGKGTDIGALGNGLYVTWDKNMAETFALIASGTTVLAYKLPSSLVLLDAQSATMNIIKETEFGFKSWDWGKGSAYSKILTKRVRDLGYDGVASSNMEEGIVIFEPKKAKLVDQWEIER